MEKNEYYQAFKKGYNNFESQPLSGEKLKNFYVEDFTKEYVDDIIRIVEITEHNKKILVSGHRGCGKSTILNKTVEKMRDQYYVIAFSGSDVLNMMDVEAVDILIVTYMKVIQSMKQERIPQFIQAFESLLNFIKQKVKIKEVGLNFLKTLSLKIIIEDDTRKAIREGLRTKVEVLQKNLSAACKDIYEQENKEILIIIDDLDKLEAKFAEKIFFHDANLLTLPETKIIFTFPLDTYYNELFKKYDDIYKIFFISPVNLLDYNDQYLEKSISSLEKLVFKRIDEKFVAKESLRRLIKYSGGLLRDLVKFMQDACFNAIKNEVPIISNSVAKVVFSEHINSYFRLFDFSKYQDKVLEIMENKEAKKIDKENLMFLLRYLFVLEYRSGTNFWYAPHPCLKENIKKKLK